MRINKLAAGEPIPRQWVLDAMPDPVDDKFSRREFGRVCREVRMQLGWSQRYVGRQIHQLCCPEGKGFWIAGVELGRACRPDAARWLRQFFAEHEPQQGSESWHPSITPEELSARRRSLCMPRKKFLAYVLDVTGVDVDGGTYRLLETPNWAPTSGRHARATACLEAIQRFYDDPSVSRWHVPSPDEIAQFGSRRRAYGMSQAKLCDHLQGYLGILTTAPVISRIENGICFPKRVCAGIYWVLDLFHRAQQEVKGAVDGE